jgi:hypothetical protein
VDSWLGEDTIEDETDGNTTWDTDKSSLLDQYFDLTCSFQEKNTYHSRVTSVPVSVGFKGRSHSLQLSIGTFNLESVLQEDDIDFTFLELTFLLQQGR